MIPDDLRQRLDALGHRSRKAVYRGPFRAQCGELVRVVVGDLGRVEAAHPVGDLLGTTEGGFEWYLLVQHHPDQQREWILGEQLVGYGILAQMEHGGEAYRRRQAMV